LYTKIINKWEKYNLGADRDFVKLTQQINLDYDGDADHKDKAEAYTYDNTNGNLTQKIEWGEVTGSVNGTFTDTGSDKITTDISYASSTSTSDVIAKPSQETVIDQNSNKVKEIKYYYDDLTHGNIDEGNETKKEVWKSDTSYITTEKTYNTYGLVTQDTDGRDKETTYVYDEENLYVATSTNPLNQSTDYYYDYTSGKIKKIIDPNGFIQETIYDGVDRVKTEKISDLDTPSSLITKTAFVYTDIVGSRKVQETNYLDSTISIDKYVYLDGLDRIIQERAEMEDINNFSVKDFQYDNRGLLYKESLPYQSTGTSKTTMTTDSNLLTTYTYDSLKRPKTIINAQGTETYSYDQWETIITDRESNTKDFTKDAFDNLITVDEHNGVSTYTTEYEYDENKKLTKITDALSNVRNFTYDGAGRRLTAQDLHDSADETYGSWSYSYDDTNNLTSKTDPKSQTVNYTFDDNSRILTEDYIGQGGTEILYEYDWCTNGIGRLCSATTTDVMTKYEYNLWGYIAKEIREIGINIFETEFEYDRQGNKTEIIYPDSSKVTYTYNIAGLLEEVSYSEVGTSTQDSIVNGIDYHSSKQKDFIQFGNGVESSYEYATSTGYHLQKIETNTDVDSSIMNSNTYSLDLERNSSQYLSITDANQTGLDIIGDFTFEAWVKIETAPSGSTYPLITKDDQSSNRSYQFGYRDRSSNLEFYTYIEDAGNNWDGSNYVNVDLGEGTWKHVAVTYDASAKEVKFYLNGSQQGSTQTSLNNSVYNGTAPFRIGTLVASTHFFDGLIDEIRVWNTVRTSTEISNNYQNELNGDETGLQGYWKLNNGYTDETTNENDITENNSPVFDESVPFTGSTGFNENLKSLFFAKVNNSLSKIGFFVLENILGTKVAYAEETSKIKKGWNYNSEPIEFNEKGEVLKFKTEFHSKWINYKTFYGWQEINTDFVPIAVSTSTVKGFEMINSPFEVFVPERSVGVAVMHNNNRWNVFENKTINEKSIDMSIQAIDVYDVVGRIERGNLMTPTGLQKNVNYVVYEGAYPEGDLIYYVDFGRIPRLEKLVRINSNPSKLNYSFNISYSDEVEFNQEKDKKKKWKKEGILKVSKNKFLKINKKESKMRGFGFYEFLLWDSNLEYTNVDRKETKKRNIEPIQVNIELKDNNSYILTKILPKKFFEESPIYPVYTDTTTTFYPDADTESTSVDGFCRYDGTSWDTVHDATSANQGCNDSATYIDSQSRNTSTGDKVSIRRGLILFDTSSIPDNDTIDEVTVSLYNTLIEDEDNDGDDFVAIVSSSPEYNTSFSSGDYDQVGDSINGPTEMHDSSDRIDLGDMSTSSYNDWSLNSTGISEISKIGISKYGFREGHDIIDVIPASEKINLARFSSADYSGTSQDPKLTVVHLVGNSAPLEPTSLKTESLTNPTEVIDNTPEFSAIYNDPDSGDIATDYQIQVATSTDFSSIYWDSTKTTLASSTPEGTRIADISYGGSALASSTLYYWRIKLWDDSVTEGSWSTATSTFVLTSAATSTKAQYFTYEHDNMGNITQIVDVSDTDTEKTIIFDYDDLYRLTSASTTQSNSNPFSRTYTYNAIGNITNKSDQGAYTYGETGYANPQAVTDINGTTYTYDNNGNVTGIGSDSYFWNWRDRLISSNVDSNIDYYAYDHENIRIIKGNGTATTTYPNMYYNISNATTTKHIFNPMTGELLATVEGNRVVIFKLTQNQ